MTEGEELREEVAAAVTPPFKARGYQGLTTRAGWGRRGSSPPRTRRPAFVLAAAPAGPSRECPRYLRAPSASMAAPPRVPLHLLGPRAPALPLGARTHHSIGAAGGRTALASAPPTPLHHRGGPRRASVTLRGGLRPRRHVTRPANGVPLLGRPGQRLAFRETWSVQRDGVSAGYISFCGLSFRVAYGTCTWAVMLAGKMSFHPKFCED